MRSLLNRWSDTHTHTQYGHTYEFRMFASSACWEKLTFSTSHTSINTETINPCLTTCSRGHKFCFILENTRAPTHTNTYTLIINRCNMHVQYEKTPTGLQHSNTRQRLKEMKEVTTSCQRHKKKICHMCLQTAKLLFILADCTGNGFCTLTPNDL